MKELEFIYTIVCDHYLLDLTTQSNKREYVDARNMYYKLSREFINISLEKIGGLVNRNYATVLHGIKSCDDLMSYNKVSKENYLILKDKCLNKLENLANPYEKYLGREDILQHKVMKYLDSKYAGVYAIHVPNEGKRSTFERFKFKYLGGKPGIPDILIFYANKNYNGLAIELKVGYNKPTENQFIAMANLKKMGWKVHWLNDYDKTIQIIDEYLQDK